MAVGSEPLAPSGGTTFVGAGSIENELARALSRKNGFYAFESALHVLPSGNTAGVMTLEAWNDPDLWRTAYGSHGDGHLFFAEDAFGGQFSIKGDAIFSFDPETADSRKVASSLDSWAETVLADFEVLTGFPLAHEWQTLHGAIPGGMRLIPKVPFVLGGAYAVENLYLGDAVEGMRLRAEIARQIASLPNGTAVEFRTGD